MENIVVFDIESDGFYYESTKIWTIHALNKTTGNKISINPFKIGNDEARKELLSFFSHADVIVGHNHLGFDMFLLRKLLGICFQVGKKGSDWLKGNDGWRKVMFLDTYFMSMFLWPDRNYKGKVGHSLEWWGNALKYPKIYYREELIKNGFMSKESPKGFEFSFYSPLMEKYCERDVDVTSAVLDRLLYDYNTLYGEDFNFQSHFKMGQKSFYLMNVQELSGWPFDIEKAKSLKDYIEKQMSEIEDKVEPQLPKRGLKKSEEAYYTMPANPFKRDGSLSSHMVNFIEKHNAKRVGEYKIEVDGKEYDIASKNMIEAKMSMKLANKVQIKDWLISQGWKPTMWNYVKEGDGSKKKTSPKLQENGVICPNLLAMETGVIKDITMWMSLRNRLGVIEGWLSHSRLSYDGRLPAGSRGLASSHRNKHRCVVNVPSTTSILGSEMRELFKAEEGMLIAAADASGLELRMQSHYSYKYDDGETAKLLLEGDAHSHVAKRVFPKETAAFDIDAEDFDKDHPGFKPWRSKAKSVSYCLPVKTKVLTIDGWKYHNELAVGDKVLSYNYVNDVVEEDIILEKYLFKDKEVIRYYNKWDSFECTSDHRWWGWKRRFIPGTNKREKYYHFFNMNEITQEHNIHLTAPWVGCPTSHLTNDECAFLGWIASEGYLSWSKRGTGTSAANGRRKEVICSITQSKNKFCRDLECVLNRVGADFSKHVKYKDNGNNTYHYHIKSPWLRPWLDRNLPGRKDKHEIDWVSLVLSMTREGMLAFYNAFYLGDGSTTGTQEQVAQNLGNIFDAVATCAQLIGRGRVSFNKVSYSKSPMKTVSVHRRKHITMQKISQENIGVQDTFCLTTKNGTFLIWQDDFMGITGNCLLYGGGEEAAAKTAGLPVSKGKELVEKFWQANQATKDFKDAAERWFETVGVGKYILALDNRILHVRAKYALVNTLFQSAGAIVMDMACCLMDMWLGAIHYDEMYRPHYVYKGVRVYRIGYFHDELEFMCEEEIAEEVADMIVKAIIKAGEALKLKIPLAGDAMVGNNWKETH